MFNKTQNFALISLLFSVPIADANEQFNVDSPIEKPYSFDLLRNESQQQTRSASSELNKNIEKDWGGASAEVGSIFILGTALYHAGGSSMERDFDYEIEGGAPEYLKDRLFSEDYWKLDDNSMGMNWGHAYAGMIYYQAFRNHNFNFYESTLATFIASTAWEAVVEYKEVISINDQIVTTVGGAVLGESLFQFSEMLASKDGWIPATFEALFNPAQMVRGWFGAPKKSRFNRKKVQDSFSVYAGAMNSTNDTRPLDKSMITFGLDATVDSRQGHYDSLSGTPSLVEISAQTAFSELGIEEFQLTSNVLLGGYYQHIQASDDKWEKSYFVGPSVGVDYASFGAEEDDEDFYAVVNVLGIAMGGDWQSSEISLLLRGSIYADFALVKPFASQGIENYRDFFWNSKSALWENGYAYALGHTANFRFEAGYRNILFGLSLRSQRWDSIDNKEFERDSDWNPNRKDLDFKDARDRYQAFISYKVSTTLTLSLHHETIHRSGEFFGIDKPDFYATANDRESRSWLQLNYSY